MVDEVGLSHPKADAPPTGFVCLFRSWVSIVSAGVAGPEFAREADLVGRRTFIARPLVAFPAAFGSIFASRRQDPHTPAPGGRKSVDGAGSGLGSGGSWNSALGLGSIMDARADAGADVDCRVGWPMTPTPLLASGFWAGRGSAAVRRDLKTESFSGRTSGIEILFRSSSTMIILSCEKRTSAL